MPALVTTPPNLIDPVGYSRQFSAEINPMGIFVVGSNLYLVLAPDTRPVPNVRAGVWKSTNGSAWAEQDAAHHPSAGSPGWKPESCTFNPATGIINIAFLDNTNFKQFVIPFNTGTNLYGAASVESAALTAPGFTATYQQSGGTLVLPTSSTVAAANKLRELDLTAGVWSGPNQLGNIASPEVYGCVVDSSDRGHLFYADASFNLQYALISSGLVLGTPLQVASSANWDGNDIDQRIWNGKIVIARTNSNKLYVSIGTPLSGAAFTEYLIDAVGGAGNLAYPTLAEDKNGNLVVFVAYTDFSGSPFIDELSMWTFDGVSSWGSPTLFYDEITNPPADSLTQTSQFIHTGAAYQFPNGVWVFATAMEIQPGGSGPIFCAGFALVTSLSPPVLACPVGGGTAQVGVPYDKTLVVTGGTGPFTFAFVGDHPSWLSLNASTGELTGTPPSVGIFVYTVQVTDANAQTAQVTCSITVSTNASLCATPLWRQDEFAMDAFNTQWSQTPAVKPRAFSVSLTPPVSMQVAPIPANNGVLDLCVVESGPALTTVDLTTLLSVADDLSWAVVFGALSDLLSQDGQSRAPTMASYYEMRYQQALDIARQHPSGLTTQVNNVPINTGSIFDLDAFLSNWQCSTGRPRYAGFVGRNLLALGPVPDDVYGITIDLVSNIPVPAADGDFIQVAREDLAVILDYAQHLASQKMAGQEFTNTMKLLKNFYAGGVVRNSRLKGTTVDKFDLDSIGSKQALQYERTEGGSPMPTDNGSS